MIKHWNLYLKLVNLRNRVRSGETIYGGICVNIGLDVYTYDIAIAGELEVLRKLFLSWKYFSGDRVYPVEGSYEKYRLHRTTRFSKTTKYGRLRRNLLNYCIREIEKGNV